MIQTCTCGTVRVGCVAASVLFGARATTARMAAQPVEAPPSIVLDDRLNEVERNLIMWALREAGGNKSKAAELLHIKRSTLGDRIARCGISAPTSPARAPAGRQSDNTRVVGPSD